MECPLGKLSPEQFLAQYWQRKPLLVRQAFPAFEQAICPDELAGLACEEDIDSRIVSGRHQLNNWRLEHGPFDENSYDARGEHDWTLLVQSVDHYVPELAELKGAFRFIPDWRLDDIMVSFAATGGSVGPHFDNYDVFLVQGSGSRQWHLGGHCPPNTPLYPHPDLRLLADFNTVETIEMQAGDMLYLPPRYAHWGVALEPCMTFSVGFRAPTARELLLSYCDTAVNAAGDEVFYRDGQLDPARPSAEIPAATLSAMRDMLTAQMTDELVSEWIGSHLSAVPGWESSVQGAALDWHQSYTLPLAARCTWIASENGHRLFINGEMFEGQGPAWQTLVTKLSDQRTLALNQHPAMQHCEHCTRTLRKLVASGLLELL